jgi:peptidyl-prolyl cis-trans isomerase B (cyclophilin B)
LKYDSNTPEIFFAMRNFIGILIILNLVIYPSFSQEKQYPIALVKTPLGDLYIELFDETPKHQNSFIQLAEKGYWDSLTFNRVIPDFVAQGGCPDTEAGFTDPKYLLEPEFIPGITHLYGAVGAGRDDNPGKLSATCQFYIVQNRNGLHRLDGDYTVFGQVIQGMDVVEKIVMVDRKKDDIPVKPITFNIEILYLSDGDIGKLKN